MTAKIKVKNKNVGYQRGDPGTAKFNKLYSHYPRDRSSPTPTKPADPQDPAKLMGSKSSYHRKAQETGTKGLLVKNKDGTIDKEETARLKKNARLMELERTKDMWAKGPPLTGEVGRIGKRDLMLNRMAKEVDKHYLEKKSKGGSLSGSKLVASFYKGGKI